MASLPDRVVAGLGDGCVSCTVQLAFWIARQLWWPINSLVIGPATRLNVKKEIRPLRTETLPAIESAIDAAEVALLRKEMATRPESQREIQANEREIEESWLLSLKDLAYDIQDIVDEVSTETARHPLPNATRWTTLNFWVDLVCGCFAPSCLGYSDDMHMLERCPLKFYVPIAYKIDAVYSKLENIKSDKDRLNILPDIVIRFQLPFVDSSARFNNDQTYEREHRLTTEVLHKDFKPVGRDEEIANIKGRLMDPQSKMLVIPIVGMPGVGKTRLAQVVFDDESIKPHFDFHKWVFVGINFDVKLVLKLVLKKLNPEIQQSNDDDLVKIYEGVIKEIKEKTFLIVLDDVWDADGKKWDDLLTPLSYGRAGSRIIITTREKEVATVACSDDAYESLTCLSRNDSVELFEKHAFPQGCLDIHSNLREIGKQIVDRLGGLPLALEVVGKALCRDKREKSWKDILNTHGIMPALAWSYERLPYHLKQCFRYCSLFSREHASESKTVLIYLWIANGYIESKENKRLEDIGNEYVNYLVSRSFFQETGDDIIKMHDLMYDLAVMVSKDEMVKIDKNTGSANIDSFKKIRHLAIYDGQRCPNTINWDRLHTVVVMDGDWKIPRNIFSQLHSIRVIMGVTGKEIECLTKNLMHLRFLRIDSIDILDVSMEPLNCLYNLQSLFLWNIDLTEDSFYIIQSSSKMSNLRILEIHGSPKLRFLAEACVLRHPSDTKSLEKVYIKISFCQRLKSIDLTEVKSIEKLVIENCWFLSEISIGLPCNLTEIRIWNCQTLKHVRFGSLDSKMSSQLASTSYSSVQYPLPHVNILKTDWHHLLNACDPTKIKYLNVYFDLLFDCIRFTSENMQWWLSLTSLETLSLGRADDLLLSSWVSNLFRNAVSLKNLSLRDCHVTSSLPEEELPRSLRQLEIVKDCPRLEEWYQDGGPGRKVLLDLIPHLDIKLPMTEEDIGLILYKSYKKIAKRKVLLE